MKNIPRTSIVAIIPIYKAGVGDCTKIHLLKKDLVLHRTIGSVLTKLFNKGSQNMIISNILSSKNLIPIFLDIDNIFIPIKFRNPIYKNDKAFGYINLNYFKSMEEEKDITRLYFSNGLSLMAKSRPKSTQKHIREGEIVQKHFENQYMVEEEIPEYGKIMAPKEREEFQLSISNINYILSNIE